jgi:hypothetical protein
MLMVYSPLASTTFLVQSAGFVRILSEPTSEAIRWFDGGFSCVDSLLGRRFDAAFDGEILGRSLWHLHLTFSRQ